MANNIQLQAGQILNNIELMEIFKCSPQGGMRRSHKTNSLILVSNHIESIYDDKWENNIFHYTGTGRNGDQSFNFSQNKTLLESNTNGITVYLFEVFKQHQYTYQGVVKLADEPYFDKQPDENLKARRVCVFPLKLVQGIPIKMNSLQTLKRKSNSIFKLYKSLSNKELKKLIEEPDTNHSNNRSLSIISRPIRRENVILYTLKRANGICQLCNQPAPFLNKNGIPFLEVHHIDFLSEGGSDTIYNTVALCPNCHRKMHIIPSHKDILKLKKKPKSC